MQFGFMPECGTGNAVFILRQLQEKYFTKMNDLYFSIVDLRTLSVVPRNV